MLLLKITTPTMRMTHSWHPSPRRKNCFMNIDFLWCVYASERHEEKDDLTRYVSILRAGSD